MGSRAADRRGRWSPALLFCFALAIAPVAPSGSPAAAPAQQATGVPATSVLPRQQVLRRALSADSSQHYLIYLPAGAARGAPLLVAAHGISRNFEEHARLLAPYAEERGVVLVAPDFPEGEFGDYQRLGRRGRRADLALDQIVREAESLTGASARTFYLFGFSGGAQFAHRYALAHPERIARAAVAAAGWYSFPDTATPYPYGIGPASGDELSDVRFEPDKFLRVPIRVFVGAADTGSRNVRRNPRVDRQQGTTRIERAQRWTAAMRRAAESRGLEPLVTCELVPGVGHSFRRFVEAGAGERVFDALFEPHGPTKPAEPATAGGRR